MKPTSAPVATPTDRMLELPSGRVRYWREGNGPPVLFVHGLGASVESWEPNVGVLAARFTACAVDLPGFGRSARGSLPFTLPGAVRFLCDFLDALGLERVHVAGNSMGGLLALKLALDCSARVDRLALLATAGVGREVTLALRLASLPLVDRLFSAGISIGQAEGAVRGVFADSSMLAPSFIRRWAELIAQPTAVSAFREAVVHGVNLLGQRRGIIQRHRLPEIAAPTLILWGDRDPVIPVAHAHIAARHIPNARLVILPGCGHCPQLERPEEVNRLLEQFLTA
ncbi:MAG: alpha/beta fold hydrolase [Chloroflexi bacterium]|nr:alpha/beta fold hydrolase [Chloroflexota bacterium]